MITKRTNVELIKTTVWTSLQDCGDGSAANRWYLSQEDADKNEEQNLEEGYGGWGESCIESIETFIGSDVHREATINSNEINGIDDSNQGSFKALY